jgi:hypothetical protein
MRAKKRVQTDRDKLDNAMRCLAKICEVASDPNEGYPEKVGAIKSLASFTLHQNGDSEWFKKFNQQLELRLQGGP